MVPVVDCEDLVVAWHDVEYGSYVVDVPAFRRLAEGVDGPILDLGAGTGRVSLELARDGHQVVALDLDEAYMAAVAHRGRGLALEAVVGGATALPREWTGRFALIIGPSNFAQIIGPPEVRQAMLRSVSRCLRHEGTLALALFEAAPPEDFVGWDEPDLGQVNAVRLRSWTVCGELHEGGRYDLWREREARFPDGRRVTERVHSYSIWHPTLDDVIAEAAACGLDRVGKPIPIPAEADETPSSLFCFTPAGLPRA